MPWYRIIKPESELKILKKRTADQETFPSAFQYLRKGVPQSYFSAFGKEKGHIGVTLKRNKERVVLWRNSGYCGVSDDIFKKTD